MCYFLQEMYIDLVNKKVKMEEQLMGISRSLCGMEVGNREKIPCNNYRVLFD